MNTRERMIHDDDVILRGGAVDNIRNIAWKFDQHRVRTIESSQEDARAVAADEMTVEEYHQRRARRLDDLTVVASRLLHGMSYMLEGARGGSVGPEDDTNLIGSGYITVGLIDHGQEWSAHS